MIASAAFLVVAAGPLSVSGVNGVIGALIAGGVVVGAADSRCCTEDSRHTEGMLEDKNVLRGTTGNYGTREILTL